MRVKLHRPKYNIGDKLYVRIADGIKCQIPISYIYWDMGKYLYKFVSKKKEVFYAYEDEL